MGNKSFVTIYIYSEFLTFDWIKKNVLKGFKINEDNFDNPFSSWSASSPSKDDSSKYDTVYYPLIECAIVGTCDYTLEENYTKNLLNYLYKLDPNVVIASIENMDDEECFILHILGYSTSVSYTLDLQAEFERQGGDLSCDEWWEEFKAELEMAKVNLHDECYKIIMQYFELVHPKLCKASEKEVKKGWAFRKVGFS